MSLSSTPIGQVTELQSAAKFGATKAVPPTETRPNSGVQAASDAANSSKQNGLDEKDRQQALEREISVMNEGLKRADDHLKFSVHKETGRIIVRLVDDETGDVLREIPSEKFLNMVVQLQQSLSGLQVDVTL